MPTQDTIAGAARLEASSARVDGRPGRHYHCGRQGARITGSRRLRRILIAVVALASLAGATGWLPTGNGATVREFRADRPFIFIVMGSRTRAILFVGRVADPRGRALSPDD